MEKKSLCGLFFCRITYSGSMFVGYVLPQPDYETIGEDGINERVIKLNGRINMNKVPYL